jgi:hypothetical protein
MRAIFGVVSLLVVLALVGMLALKQLKAVDKNVGASLPPAQTATDAPAAAAPASTVRAGSQQAQQRVVGEVGKALEQGAARSETADK